MRFPDLLFTALAALRRRKFHASLTVLGVLIGITAMVLMISLGIGLAAIQDGFIENQANLRQVEVTGVPQSVSRGQKQRIDEATLLELRRIPGVKRAWPFYEVNASARVGGVEGSVRIRAIPSYAMDQQGLEIAEGKLPRAGSQLQIAVGHKFYEAFANPGSSGSPTAEGTPLTGRTVKLDIAGVTTPIPGREGTGASPSAAPQKKLNATITGVFKGQKVASEATANIAWADLDQMVKALKKTRSGKALPGQEATPEGRAKGTFLYSGFVLDAGSVREAELLLKHLRENGYEASAPIEMIRQAQEQPAFVQAILGGVGAVSLLATAVGIANTMMMSVHERTREIGVMKVLGAARRDIRRLLLLEAAGIGLLGGLLAVGASLLLSHVLNETLGRSLTERIFAAGETCSISVIPFWLLLSAVGFATLTGAIVGFPAAQRAMKLNTLKAVRAR